MLKLIEWNEEILPQLILQERGLLTRAEARKKPSTLTKKEHHKKRVLLKNIATRKSIKNINIREDQEQRGLNNSKIKCI